MRHLFITILLAFSAPVIAQELYIMPEGRSSHVSSFENRNGLKGQGGKTNQKAKGNAFEALAAGESKTLLDIKGAGIIQRMWFTVNNRTPQMLRSLRLQMFWDNATKPAVDVPFGDFFGIGLGRTVTFESALFSSPEGRSFNSFVPMPFKTSAKVVITNESKEDLSLLFYDIDFVKVTSQPKDMLYFCAYWHRQKSSAIGTDFELLPKVLGKGRYLGVNVGVNADTSYRTSWFGEGEVKMFIDGDSEYPTINGTGTEDYIGTGWGQGTFINRYQGSSIVDEAKQQYCFYRFHIPDQIFFQKDFKATIQQIGGGDLELLRKFAKKGAKFTPISVATDKGFIRLFEGTKKPSLMDEDFPKGWVNFYRSDDYSATAYFYLDKPQHNLSALVPVAERIN